MNAPMARFKQAVVFILVASLVYVSSGAHSPATLAQPVAPPSGQIFVTDQGNHRIVRIDDMTGAGWTTFGTLGSDVNQFAGPHAHWVNAAGQIYVADTANSRVVRINDMTGTGWTTFGSFGSGVNQFNGLRGIFATDSEQVYVADSTNGRIVRIDDISGAGWTTLGTAGPGVKQFFFPDAIFVSAARQIYVTDQDNARIVRMDDMTGAGWTTFGSFGSGVNQFNRPYWVVVSDAGQIYVTDQNNNRIVRIDDMTGAGWTTFGTLGSGVNQFIDPSGIVFHTKPVVSKTAAPEPVTLGHALTYTITAANNGPPTAVTLTDPLPTGVTFVSAAPSQGSCSGTSTVTCSLGTLVSGATATVAIVVTPTATGTLTNTVTVAGTTIESTARTTVLPRQFLSVVRAGTGSGTVTSSPTGISCGTTCSASFASGTSVMLTATPDSTSTFASWSGCDIVLGTQCAVALTRAKTVTATFQPISASVRLTITKAGSGSGVVTSPTGIFCGGICTQVQNKGTVLTLTATPDTGSTFSGWSDGTCSGTGSCMMTLTADTTVTATFTAPAGQFALAVALRGSGTGTVTSNPSGIACGTSCAKLFALGTTVTLTASAGPVAAFKGWIGGGCSGPGACTVAMTATAMKSVFAIFSAAFTDPDPTAGSSVIRGVDITELRSAVNKVGAQNIGASFAFTDPTIAVGSTVVKAVHFTELRTAVGNACIQAGVAPPNYTDSTLTTGLTVIRAVDLNELRSAVHALD